MSQEIKMIDAKLLDSTIHMNQISNVHQNILQQNIIPSACAVEIPRSYGLPELSETMDPRELDIKNLLELINKSRKVLITGIGGLGKTTLAILSAKKWMKDDEFKHVVFVNVDNHNSVDAVYQRLAELILNTKVYSDNIITELYEYYNNEKTLFIFDNIEENRILSKYMPSEKLTNIYLLGTSQFTELTKVFQIFPLQTLSEEASVNLIQDIFKNNHIKVPIQVIPLIINLVKKLEYHPLALQHAAALIFDMKNNNNISLKKSLDEYNQQFEILFRTEFPAEHLTKYNKSVNTALEMNIRKAIKSDDIKKAKSDEEKHVQTLLFCMSYLDPSDINIKMFYKHPDFNENCIQKSVRELKKYSIITINKFNIITLHRLIQTVCHSMITENEKMEYLIILLNIFFYYENGNYSYKNMIKNHCHFLIQHLEMNFKINKEKLSKLYIELFYKNDKKINYLNSRLKLINCDITDIKDWSVQQYCVFAGHKVFFDYFNEKKDIDNTNEEIWDFESKTYHSQIFKNSEMASFYHGKSFVDVYKCNTNKINQPTFKGLVVVSLCAAFGVSVFEYNKLISLGCDINLPDSNGITPILWAAKNMSYSIVFLLHRRGAIYDNQYKELLSLASKDDHKSVLYLLRTSEVNYAKSDFGKTLLWWAAKKKYYDLVRELIHQGAPITGVDCAGNTILHFIAYNGYSEIIAQLLSLGLVADVNSVNIYGDTPILRAAGCGHTEVVEHLIHAGANVHCVNNIGDMPLMCAAENGHCAVVTKLIVAGADVNVLDRNGATPLFLAAYKGYSDVVIELINADADVDVINYNSHSPLLCAAQYGHREIIIELIRVGADVNIVNNNGNTALSYAAYFGHYEVVVELIRAGADLNTVNIFGNPPLLRTSARSQREGIAEFIRLDIDVTVLNSICDTMTRLVGTAAREHSKISLELIRAGAEVNIVNIYNNAALLFAAYYGYRELITEMINLGAQVNTVNSYGDTPLLLAAERGYHEIVVELINSGADVNIANIHGSTPLLMATEYSYRVLIKDLLNQGADVNIVDDEGETPILFASKYGDSELVIELISRGANIDIPPNKKGETLLSWALRNKDERLEQIIKNKKRKLDDI